MPTDCRGTLRRTVRSRNNRIATVRVERCSADGNLGGLLQRGGRLFVRARPERHRSRRWTITGTRVEEFDSLDAAMQRLLQRYAVRAGSLAVARQRKLLFARGYTWAEPDYPVTQADSPFRLASVSKAFTAAVIYQLLQAKKLELSLPVFPWLGLDRAALPGQTVDPRLATITVQQLINHRGGWDSRAANFDPVFSMRRIARRLGLRAGPSSRDIARFMVGEPLQFTPGTQERYSNFGYVDGRSVERNQACPRFDAAGRIHDYTITTLLTT
jgi:CubicO group peptidase (beta-lactamase class C family)